MNLKIDHLGIAVKDLGEAVKAYEALGFHVEATHDVPTEKVRAAFLPIGESHLELLEPTDPTSVIARFLEKRSGLHHVCVLVDDIVAALAELKAKGVPLLDEKPRLGAGGSGSRSSTRRARGGAAGAEAAMSVLGPISMGDVRVHVLSDGTFALDGGAMFGVVPRVIWEKTDPPDEKNRVTLGLNVLLVETGGQRLLIDTGLGDKWGEKEVGMYRIDRSSTLPGGLRELGLGLEDVDVVINTHLHFDHAGGNTHRAPGGAVPRSRAHATWSSAANGRTPRGHTSAAAPPIDPTTSCPWRMRGSWRPWTANTRWPPASRVPMGGHTRHHQMVVVRGGGETLMVPTDLLPTTSHLPPRSS